ncbi:oligomeric, coiled-coil, peripheral membrane protein [Rhodotorula kratochvilovae]
MSSWLSRSDSRAQEQPAHEGADRAPSLFAVRSSDGAQFALVPDDFANISTLDELRFNLLSPLLSIPHDCLILMNEEGSPLNRDEAVQHLALLAQASASGVLPSPGGPASGSLARSRRGTERRVYVFDRDHLDADPDEVAALLAITDEQVLTEPPLNPEDPLTSHLSLSSHNLATLRALISSIELQHASLALALSNLHRVNTGTSSSFALFLEGAAPTLERYEALLDGWEAAMDAVGKVGVVAGLLMRHAGSGSVGGGGVGHGREGSSASLAMRGAGGEDKQRVLGDYVSRDKMLAVRDGCAKVLAELKMRSESLQQTLDEVVGATQAVQADLEATSNDLQDLEACEHDAVQGHLRIEELVQAGEHMTDPILLSQCFEELTVCDAEHRDRIRFLVERKNAMTRYLLQEMQKISTLQSDIASMPAELGALDHDLRTRTDNFKHLARLEDLIPAYVATVAEVVRRREYARLLGGQSTTLSATFAPLSDTERTRRLQYRQDYSGKLPWEVRGLNAKMDELVPEMALEVLDREQGLPELGRETLDTLQQSFQELDDTLGDSAKPGNPLRRARVLLQTLAAAIDDLNADFAHLAPNAPPPRAPSIDPARLVALEAQVRVLEEGKDVLERQLQAERSAREEDVAQLEARASAAESAAAQAREARQALERERDDAEGARADAAAALVGAEERLADEADRRDAAEREVGSARAAEAELKKQWSALDLSHTRVQGELGAARVELERVKAALAEQEAEANAARDAQKALALVVAEKDRLLRDQRSEAELDRAVLEKEADELRTRLAAREKDVEQARARTRTLEEIVEGLREQVARWEKVAHAKEEDVDAVKREVEDARREKEKGIVDVQKELIRVTALARDAVTLAGRMRDENNNIAHILNTPPPSKGEGSTTELDKAVQVPSPTPQAAPVVPPLDYAAGDLDELLRELKAYTHDSLTDAVKNKVDSLTSVTKKWVKEAKAYRERAHRAASGANDKIAFRNFAKGDLALFLPTRNSAVPVWAAFNVSFPHHFLSATGVVAEQMKTREWIVARITSLTEKVVDAKDPSTNPYLLAAGTKYFTLEVEPWSSKDSSRARRHSGVEKNKSSEKKSSSRDKEKEPRASRASEPAVPTARSLSMSSAAAESAILVDRPTPSSSMPNIRRSASEGGALPPNATALARSEFTIAEADEDEPTSRTPSPQTLRQIVPRPDDRYDLARSSPSGIARALARSNPATPVANHRPDPFVPSSPGLANPFTSSSTPLSDSPLRHTPTPPTTDYDPAHLSTGAAPAFLPSSGRKPHSGSGSASGSVAGHSPRYVRSPTRPTAVPGSSRAPQHPSVDLLSASPASTSASSINVLSHPRSASSGSIILSSSLHRRAASGAFPHSGAATPPVPGGKAPSTAEAQFTDSRWSSLQDELASRSGALPSTSASMTLGRKTTKGWPLASAAATGSPAPSSPGASTPRSQGDRALSTSAGSASIFDVLRGRRPSTAARKEGVSDAEGEMRKLLGQPQF